MSTALERLRRASIVTSSVNVTLPNPMKMALSSDLALALAVIEAARACVADTSDHGDMMLPDLLEQLHTSITVLTKEATWPSRKMRRPPNAAAGPLAAGRFP